MDELHLPPKGHTQTQLTTDSQLDSTKFAPIRSFPHLNSLDSSKPWYHLFRPSLLGPNTPPPSQSQSLHHEDRSFQFCQARLIAATEDLSKLIQNISSTFTQDKTSIETLIGSVRELIETTHGENNAQHDNRMKELDGQLVSMRRLIETVSDLNSAVLNKLIKVDGAVEILVSANSKLEARIESIEGQWERMESMEQEWMNLRSSIEQLISQLQRSELRRPHELPDWIKSSPSPIPERTQINPFLEKLSSRSSGLTLPKQRSSITDDSQSNLFDLTLSPPTSRDLSRGKSRFIAMIEPSRLQALHEPGIQVVPVKESVTTKSKNTAKKKASPPPKRQTRATTKRRKLTNEGSNDGEIQQLEKMARGYVRS